MSKKSHQPKPYKGHPSAGAYPEHDKLHAVKYASQAIGQFLDALQEQGLAICSRHMHTDACWDEIQTTYPPSASCGFNDGEWVADTVSINDRLARYFDIDLRKLEDEKLAMLETIRART